MLLQPTRRYNYHDLFLKDEYVDISKLCNDTLFFILSI